MKLLTALIITAALVITGCEKLSFNLSPEQSPYDYGEQENIPSGNTDLAHSSVEGIAGMDNVEPDATLADNLALHQKYIKTADRLLQAQQDNASLTEKNRLLATKVASLTEELTDARSEINDANDMLMTLGTELKKWKADIFVYRKELLTALDEIRNSQAKTMRFLGADTPTDTQTTEALTANDD